MIFKGTPNRNYFEISDEIDYLGANVNAHTTKEETVFYINALTQFLGKSVDILFDIVINSTIDEKELEKEKDVIVAVAQGMTNKEIADHLCISTNTVITHRRNIARKLQIHSPAGLTIYAIVNNLVDISSVKL